MSQNIKVTYVYHSCFVLEVDNNTLLFDPPGKGFLPKGAWNKIEKTVEGKELYVFISHGHADHYTPLIFELEPKKAYYVLSEDVISKDKGMNLSDGEDVKIGSVRVRTLKSNDEGLAYLIHLKGNTIYFGGDLAKWDWPEWCERKRRKHVEVFERTLEYLKKLKVDMAFSNMDKRLKSWAGPVDFINAVKPRFFVPIHTFGNEEWIDDLIKADIPKETSVFNYRKPWDSVVWNV